MQPETVDLGLGIYGETNAKGSRTGGEVAHYRTKPIGVQHEPLLTINRYAFAAQRKAIQRTDGLELLKRLPRPDRIAVHWGMVMAVYPFWAAVASYTGRFLKLQRSAGRGAHPAADAGAVRGAGDGIPGGPPRAAFLR